MKEQNEDDGTIAQFEKVFKIRPAYAQARITFGRTLEHRGRPGDMDAAAEQYRQAIESDPTLADAHYNLGVLLINRGSTAEAIAEFTDALKYNPDQANAHYNLANCLERQGKYAAAMVSWRTALRLQPHNVDTVDQVAWRLATSPDVSVRDGRQAVELAQQAVRLSRGEDPRPISTLACRYCSAAGIHVSRVFRGVPGFLPKVILACAYAGRILNTFSNWAMAPSSSFLLLEKA